MKTCTTHHHACDCRKEMIKTVCEKLLQAHEVKDMFDRKLMDCPCEAARELLK